MISIMQSFHGPADRSKPFGPGIEDEDEVHLNVVLDEMLANQTPRQKELAGLIWDRFVAGDDVDDVKDLIADLSRTATEDAEERREARRTGGIQ
jgi:hypothetical protein